MVRITRRGSTELVLLLTDRFLAVGWSSSAACCAVDCLTRLHFLPFLPGPAPAPPGSSLSCRPAINTGGNHLIIYI